LRSCHARVCARTVIAIATAAAALVLAGPAAATTVVFADGTHRPQPYQGWIDRTHVPTPNGTLTLVLGPCAQSYSWAAACADPAARTVYLDSDRRRDTFLHEVGHLFDARAMRRGTRAAFQRLIGRRGPWDAPPATDPPSEQFAEAYSLCARKRTLRSAHFGMYDYIVSPRVHLRVCALIRRAQRATAGS